MADRQGRSRHRHRRAAGEVLRLFQPDGSAVRVDGLLREQRLCDRPDHVDQILVQRVAAVHRRGRKAVR